MDDFVPLRQHNTPTAKSSMAARNKHDDVTVDQLRSRNGIEVDGTNIPQPIESFEDLKLPHKSINFLKHVKHFVRPTPIQMQSISCLLDNRDVIGLSPTGSGKTYAYLLPMCLCLMKNRMNTSPTCLILVPTRELATQIKETVTELLDTLNLDSHFDQIPGSNQVIHNSYVSSHSNGYVNHSQNTGLTNHFQDSNSFYTNPSQNAGSKNQFQNVAYTEPSESTRLTNQFQSTGYANHIQNQQSYTQPNQLYVPSQERGINSCNQMQSFQKDFAISLYGGVPLKDNIAKLGLLPKVIVATPGRLLDLCDKNYLQLSNIQYFVIDECDKLLEMGLEESLRKIVALVTIQKNSVLQTSLWSATLPESLERLARSAVVNPIYICTGVKDTVPKNISQNVLFLHAYMKPKMLLDVLRQTPYPPVIIFTASKHKAEEIVELLHTEQFHAAVIHSGKEQRYREEIMDNFRKDQIDILVATDLISRGLDIPAVTHIINFDTPNDIESYVHRCGRTGRFGRAGLATTFLTLGCTIAKELKEMLESTQNNVPHELQDVKMFGRNVLSTDMGDRIVT